MSGRRLTWARAILQILALAAIALAGQAGQRWH